MKQAEIELELSSKEGPCMFLTENKGSYYNIVVLQARR